MAPKPPDTAMHTSITSIGEKCLGCRGGCAAFAMSTHMAAHMSTPMPAHMSIRMPTDMSVVERRETLAHDLERCCSYRGGSAALAMPTPMRTHTSAHMPTHMPAHTSTYMSTPIYVTCQRTLQCACQRHTHANDAGAGSREVPCT